jgi:diguanylate cyclase (GGDEF)-like protein
MDEVFPHLRDAGLPQFYAEVQRSGEAKSWNHQILDDEGGLVTAFNLNAFPLPGQCVGVVFADVTGRRQAELALERMAFTDVLTGLPNRRMVHDAIGRALGLAKRHGRTIAVLFLDMNGFKKVNDTLGHEIGDLAIQAFATRLSGCVRTSDMVARLGGDEFIVLLSEVAAPDDGADVARKILEAMRPPFDLAGHPATLGAAIGIAEYPGPGEDADTLIKQADAAMYQAKQTKSGYCHWRDVRADSSPA